jgi:hypothetical protein
VYRAPGNDSSDGVVTERVSSGLLGCITEQHAYPNGCCPDVEGDLCRVELPVFHFSQSSNSHGVKYFKDEWRCFAS